MSSFELNENICRICLGSNELFDWNKEIFEFCGITYKDCYFKYIHLEEIDSDFYPKNLCEMCAHELRNAHFLFERALESFHILQCSLTDKDLIGEYFDAKICKSHSAEGCESETYSNELVELSEAINFTGIDDGKSIAKSEDETNNSNELLTEIVTIEPIPFMDMQNFESTTQVLLEQQLNQRYDTTLDKSYDPKSVTRGKNRRHLLSDDEKLTKSAASGKTDVKRSSQASVSDNLTDQNQSGKCNTKFAESSTTNRPAKTRKKYILICQYCSLKVDGTTQLKIHEATHSENRERTETCKECGLKLYTKCGLKEHMRIHEENRQRKHKCEFCEKAFFNKGALNVHRRIHLGLMVKCQICSKEFYRQIDLNKHLLKHSASPLQKFVGKRKYVVQCEHCNKSVFTNRIKEHMARHSDQPQVKCKICDKHFFSRTKCSAHLRKFHRKSRSEYEKFTHFFVNCNTRVSFLKFKQEGKVQPLTKEEL